MGLVVRLSVGISSTAGDISQTLTRFYPGYKPTGHGIFLYEANSFYNKTIFIQIIGYRPFPFTITIVGYSFINRYFTNLHFSQFHIENQSRFSRISYMVLVDHKPPSLLGSLVAGHGFHQTLIQNPTREVNPKGFAVYHHHLYGIPRETGHEFGWRI